VDGISRKPARSKKNGSSRRQANALTPFCLLIVTIFFPGAVVLPTSRLLPLRSSHSFWTPFLSGFEKVIRRSTSDTASPLLSIRS